MNVVYPLPPASNQFRQDGTVFLNAVALVVHTSKQISVKVMTVIHDFVLESGYCCQVELPRTPFIAG